MISISRILVLVLGLIIIGIEAHYTPKHTSTSSASIVEPPRKRGLAYINPPDIFQDFQTTAANTSFITWGYDWGSAVDPAFPAYLEYVPMLWGADASHTMNWVSDVNNAISRGTKNILSFNEPDLAIGADMTPLEAANTYLQWIQPFAGRVKLGAPAASESPSGTMWLEQFIGNCTGCTIDFVPVHIYSTYDNVAHYQQHIQDVYNVTGKPIWVTEFHASGTEAQQHTFLETLMPWLDAQTYVHRYAWYKCSHNYTGGNLCQTGGTPTALGELYAYYI